MACPYMREKYIFILFKQWLFGHFPKSQTQDPIARKRQNMYLNPGVIPDLLISPVYSATSWELWVPDSNSEKYGWVGTGNIDSPWD